MKPYDLNDMVAHIRSVMRRMEKLDKQVDVSVLNATDSSLVKLGMMKGARAVLEVEMLK